MRTLTFIFQESKSAHLDVTMSITSTLPTEGTKRKRQHHSGDDNNKEEQSSTKCQRPTLLSWLSRGLGGWLFSGGAPDHGIQSHGGNDDGIVGHNGTEVIPPVDEDAIPIQLQFNGVNADNDGGNNRAGALRDRTNTINIQCPNAPIKPSERLRHGQGALLSNEDEVAEDGYLGNVDNRDSAENDEEDEDAEFNRSLLKRTNTLLQNSMAIVIAREDSQRVEQQFEELQLLQEEEDRIEVSEELRRELDQEEYEEEKEQLQQITEVSNWEREARDAVDEQNRQEEEDGYNELQLQQEEDEQNERTRAELERSLREMVDDGSSNNSAVEDDEDITTRCEEEEDEEYTHRFYESEQPLNEVAAVEQDEDDEEEDEEEENEADTDVTEQQSNEEVTTKNDGQVETDEAYARALQHHFDDEQSRQSRQEKGDAALALVLQNEDSPHAREISSSTNPSESFEFNDTQQEVEEQCADAVVAAMAVEVDEDMTEEVAMEALVDPRSDDDVPGRPTKIKHRHTHYSDNDDNDFGMTQRGLTFDDVSLDEEDNSIDYQHVICDKCQALRVFEDLNKIGDRNLCSICEENSSFIPPEAETTCETGEDNSSASLPANRRRPTFEDLKADGYGQIYRVKEAKRKCPGYRGELSVSVGGKETKLVSKLIGSGQAALLEFVCLQLAQDSEMTNGIITSWKGLRGDPMSLQQFKDDLSHDVELMKRMPKARKHLGRSDLRGEGDLAVTAIRAVANNLSGKLCKGWECDSSVLEHIVGILEEVANGTRSEFPWVGTSFTRTYDFPSRQEWLADLEKVQLQLGNRDEKMRAKTKDITHRLESVLYLFAHQPTANGYHGPPLKVTMAKRTCSRWECALLALEAMFQGLLFDGECGDESFIDYIPLAYHEDPTTMPHDMKGEVVCQFLVAAGVFPEWYKPSYLRAEIDSEERYDINASPDEIQQMKEEIAKMVGTLQNLERLREERRLIAAKVR